MILSNFRWINNANRRYYDYGSNAYKSYLQNVKTTSNVALGSLMTSSSSTWGHPASFYSYDTASTQRSQLTNGEYTYYGGGSSSYIAIGSGTTAPTLSDYALESEITGIAVTSSTRNFSGAGTTFTRVFNNNTDSAITVSEIGIITCLYCPGDGNNRPVLLTREVLSTPMTIQPGETFTVVVTIP